MVKQGKGVLIFFGLVICLALFHTHGFAENCPPGMVWVPGFKTAEGDMISGFCRPAERKGYLWIDGHPDPKGIWISGFWKPIGPPPPGKIWVPGYVDHNGVWTDGFWRRHHSPGKAWVHGHYGPKGRWIPGHWK